VTKFRQEIMPVVCLVWNRDWKLIENEEVEEVAEPPLKKLASRSLIMKSTASLHAILSGRKPTNNANVP
jgi:hypothetical protein